MSLQRKEKIVQRRYDEAALTFLSEPRLVETEEAKEARVKLKETLDYKQALKIFPKYLKFEIAMLNYLVKHPKDTECISCYTKKTWTTLHPSLPIISV